MTTEADNAMPLDFEINTQNIDTTRPVLANGIYAMRIESILVAPNKNQDGKNAIITFATTAPAQDPNGRTISPGFKIKAWYPLQSKDKETGEPNEKWRERFAQLQDAALGTDINNRPAFRREDVEGRVVAANVKIRQADNGQMMNDIASVSALPNA